MTRLGLGASPLWPLLGGLLLIGGFAAGVVAPMTDYRLPPLPTARAVDDWIAPRAESVITQDGERWLHLHQDDGGITRHVLTTLTLPPVGGDRVLVYTAARANLQGHAVFEAVATTRDGQVVAERSTNAWFGVMGRLGGTRFRDQPREINLPLDSDGPRPQRIQINVVIHGTGDLWIQPVRVFAGWPMVLNRFWFSATQAAQIAQIVAFSLALLGAAMALLYWRGGATAIPVLRWLCGTGFLAGFALWAVGTLGLFYHQPALPLVTLGGTAWLLLAVLAQLLRRRAESLATSAHS